MTKAWLPTLFLTGTLLLAPGCDSSKPDLSYQDQAIPNAIDMHLHTGEWALIPRRTQAYLASKFPFPFSLNPAKLADDTLSAEGILDQMDGAGIDKAVLLAVYAPNSVGITKNEWMIKEIEQAPERFYGFASVQVDEWDDDEEAQLNGLKEALAHPQVIGIKLAHAHQDFEMNDPRFYSIYEVAGEAKTPVYLHTGSSPFPGTIDAERHTDAAYLEEAISAYPETVFILGHLGFDFINQNEGTLENCIDLAKRYPNVYLEPSAMGSKGADPTGEYYALALTRIKEEGLIDRLIYGSDGPQYPGFLKDYASRTLDAMANAEFTLEEANAFFYENFVRVFGVEQ